MGPRPQGQRGQPGGLGFRLRQSSFQLLRFIKLARDGSPVNLVKEHSKQPPDALSLSVRAMMDQLWTYMVVTGVEFSWFSCYYYTWIARRSPDDPQRSCAFHSHSAMTLKVATAASL